MQAQAYDGYFKNGRFYASGRTVNIPEERRVIITILEDTPPKPTPTSTINKNDVARNFLLAMKELRATGFTAEDDKSIDEFQSGAYRLIFEERL